MGLNYDVLTGIVREQYIAEGRETMTALAETYMHTIATLADIRPAAVKLTELAMRMGGFRVAATDNIASKQPMIDIDGNILAEDVWGWTQPHERWWTNSRLALVSPLTRACRYESEPFWCNTKGFWSRQTNPYLQQMDLTDFEKRACCNAAIVVPVHLPLGQIGAMSFTPRDGREDLSAEFEQWADTITLVAQRFLSGYAKVTRQRQLVPGDCQLTKREVECLRWAAVGKTDKEISMILSRSHATIRFHIKNAGEKLNTVNRSQTIFKAAQLGYLAAAA
jgi:DNA-binding CsgD family transcriptional regulator